MSKNLVIVESPAKARTIGRFLGKSYVVKASMGHVRDLPKSGLGIETSDGSFEPSYRVMPDKRKIITELRFLFYKIFQTEFSGICGPLNLSKGSVVLMRQ